MCILNSPYIVRGETNPIVIFEPLPESIIIKKIAHVYCTNPLSGRLLGNKRAILPKSAPIPGSSTFTAFQGAKFREKEA